MSLTVYVSNCVCMCTHDENEWQSGNLQQISGHYDQALALYERALVVLRISRSTRHPLMAKVVIHMAECCNALGTSDGRIEY